MTNDTMRTAVTALGAALALGIATAEAQETPLVRERLQLWADCSPLMDVDGRPVAVQAAVPALDRLQTAVSNDPCSR